MVVMILEKRDDGVLMMITELIALIFRVVIMILVLVVLMMMELILLSHMQVTFTEVLF